MDTSQSPGHADIKVAACLPITIHEAEHFTAKVSQGATFSTALLSCIKPKFKNKNKTRYIADSIYSMYKDKLQNRSLNPWYTKGGPLRTPEGDFLWSCRNYNN